MSEHNKLKIASKVVADDVWFDEKNINPISYTSHDLHDDQIIPEYLIRKFEYKPDPKTYIPVTWV